ncbi:MAG TPA: serine hydroxymethyltransferase [Oligoflexia bacterium]|nr:serine hydroxymethyltransferase [Oligoflexia bacterium]HMP27216.1 serine hydroxymethyltransferase [Oligoflexia bacterium]
MNSPLKDSDPEIHNLIWRETERQEYGLEMIPSENFVSAAVLEACGSILTNKYAEGLPGKRYYGGCAVVDEVEEVAIERAKKLFGAEAVNVQPHSGAQANQAVFTALLKNGDSFLGMRLDHGGHLTHGSPVNFSGMNYQVISYGVKPYTELIDYDQVRQLAREHKPKLILAGASAYPRQIDFKIFAEIAREIGAIFMVDIAHYAGLVVAGCYPNPIPYADVVTTTTHKTLRGPRSGLILAKESYIKAINKAVFPGLQGGPHMHTIAAKAVCFKEASEPSFKAYGLKVIENARALAKELEASGLRIVTGGTDSHIVLVDLRGLGVTGKVAQDTLDKIGVSWNKNTIPFDPEPPTVCSGIRGGTPALTTRGMGADEMKKAASIIVSALQNHENQDVLKELRSQVKNLSAAFPLYADRLVS